MTFLGGCAVTQLTDRCLLPTYFKIYNVFHHLTILILVQGQLLKISHQTLIYHTTLICGP